MSNETINTATFQCLAVSSRIAPLDGFRSVAALGVVWHHAWSFTGFPKSSLAFGPFDVNRLLAIAGDGVHLFFVISGFCMYLMYGHRPDGDLSYARFVVRRWWRIAPAYYACILVSASLAMLVGKKVTAIGLGKHFVFAHLWPPGENCISPPFWSLATEWHFYLLLPVLVWAWRRWPFGLVFGVCCVSALVVRGVAYTTGWGLQYGEGQIWLRLVEFLWGVGVAHLYLHRIGLPQQAGGTPGILAACGVVYIGRAFRLTEVTSHFSQLGSDLLRTISDPLMTLGFAWLIWHVISKRSWLSTVLETRPMSAIGRWSYSLYLWHWYPCAALAWLGVREWGSSVLVQYLTLILSLVILVPVSAMSYAAFEKPYLRGRSRASTTPTGTALPNETLFSVPSNAAEPAPSRSDGCSGPVRGHE